MDIAQPAGSAHRRQRELLEASRRLLRQSADTIAQTRFVLDRAQGLWSRRRLRDPGNGELTLSDKMSTIAEQAGLLVAETRTTRDSVRAKLRTTQMLRALLVGKTPSNRRAASDIASTGQKNGRQAQA